MLAMVDSSKSRNAVENEAFEHVMYGGEPPKRPLGFGFGVVKRNIYGVHGKLREGRCGKVHKRNVENEAMNISLSALNSKNAELEKRNEELQETVNQNSMLFMSVLEAIRDGNVSTELIDVARSSLRVPNPMVNLVSLFSYLIQ